MQKKERVKKIFLFLIILAGMFEFYSCDSIVSEGLSRGKGYNQTPDDSTYNTSKITIRKIQEYNTSYSDFKTTDSLFSTFSNRGNESGIEVAKYSVLINGNGGFERFPLQENNGLLLGPFHLLVLDTINHFCYTYNYITGDTISTCIFNNKDVVSMYVTSNNVGVFQKDDSLKIYSANGGIVDSFVLPESSELLFYTTDSYIYKTPGEFIYKNKSIIYQDRSSNNFSTYELEQDGEDSFTPSLFLDNGLSLSFYHTKYAEIRDSEGGYHYPNNFFSLRLNNSLGEIISTVSYRFSPTINTYYGGLEYLSARYHNKQYFVIGYNSANNLWLKIFDDQLNEISAAVYDLQLSGKSWLYTYEESQYIFNFNEKQLTIYQLTMELQ